ncbi:1-acyl-sn-glycerol-3-phosphate acyltransferase [Advenella kashmirensis W13003]|uniref:1-acyl-sn-glycerol-3-phosphate acyltransferase n=1 Tax=Advenella kashmirensis W13003 TaxID=1424334 RepID=V8QNU9_9BURK|nr:lysophospholipid acyltransferase family protein [Advenella kashmirensis]ETF01327.1 1-acyl-sn-glycerol-3-phosphate acyltransferase [Advenella kashmirensis W13003]
MLFLRSVLFLLFQAVTVVPYAIGCVLVIPLPFTWRYRYTVGWPRMVLWAAKILVGIKYETKGVHHIPDAPVIYLSKHQSTYETMFFAWFLPRPACFVYKKELNYIPFFGWGLASLRNIAIDRKKGKNAMQQVMEIGTQRLAEGRAPVLFPEGTRIPPGQAGTYKLGGTRLAVHANTPIIPVAHNAGECWPKKPFVKKPGLVTISFGPPIEPAGRTPDEVMADVRTWIEGEMRVLNPERYHDVESV